MKTKHLAITGNIGSGKTTVCRFFEYLGVSVYYSDSRAKALMNNNKLVRNKIKNLLGKKAYTEENIIDRSYIASKIFSDKSLLSEMNAIVHPAVRDDYIMWRNNQKGPITLQESALTFETKAHKIMDATILIFAPEPLLIYRSMQRDSSKESDVKERLSKQMSQDKKREKADHLIYNGLGELIYPQVIEIYNLYNK